MDRFAFIVTCHSSGGLKLPFRARARTHWPEIHFGFGRQQRKTQETGSSGSMSSAAYDGTEAICMAPWCVSEGDWVCCSSEEEGREPKRSVGGAIRQLQCEGAAQGSITTEAKSRTQGPGCECAQARVHGAAASTLPERWGRAERHEKRYDANGDTDEIGR